MLALAGRGKQCYWYPCTPCLPELRSSRQSHHTDNILQCSHLCRAGRLDGHANRQLPAAYRAQDSPRSACQGERISFPLQGPNLGMSTHKVSWLGSTCTLLGILKSGNKFPAWPNLLSVQLIPDHTIRLQEVLGYPNARQICQDSEVTGHAKSCQQ